ncbi:hypothetical protein PC9H_001087 [Pleurotus ostreatus]|uniref:NYN domain-containing protein n=1 Tax=Pleurotus ostreatus TaxID=5322 RepID=A0A8H7A4Q1_PLEOS|nr:uncharacterized protein PC9H_001087 [Pleurotus ostreatus]KAF7440739.1 hypothetical protein PC9H_001087 [Pleurotus ostreatus]
MLGRHDNKDVAIFWDYGESPMESLNVIGTRQAPENCHGPSAISGYDVVGSIRNVAHKFGSVKLFKAYLELSEQSMSPRLLTLRSELQSSGVSLTDCPHNGRKNVADQMIMVDMLAYAIDRPAPATIILISGDRDFAYAASVLRLRRYSVVVISLTNPGAHPSLKAQANICLDWNADVMSKVEEEHCHSIQRHEPMFAEEISGPAGVRQRSSTVSTAADILLAPSVHKREIKPSGPIRHKRDNSINHRNIAINVDKATQTHGNFIDTPCSCQATLVPEHLKEDLELPDTRSLREHQLEGVHGSVAPALEASSSAKADLPTWPFSPLGPANGGEEAPLSTQNEALAVSDNPQPLDATASERTKKETVPLDDFPLPVTMSQRVEAFKKMVVLLRQQEQCRSLRLALACELVSAGVVPQAGARDFQDYLYLAECSGLIEQGGSKAEAWVSLHSQWQDSDEYENIFPQSLAQPSTNTNELITPEVIVVDDTPIFTPQSTPLSLASWCDMAGCRDVLLPDVGPAKQINPPDNTDKDNAAPITDSTFHLSAQAPPFVPPIPLQVRSAAIPATTSRNPVPPHFILLVEILLRYSAEGLLMVSRSKVAIELLAKNKLIYQQAGVSRFGEYAALAQSSGLVELGTSEGGDPWISLSLSIASDCPSPSTSPPETLSPPITQRCSAAPGPSLINFHLPTPRPSKPPTTPEPARTKLASHFWPLIDILEEHRRRGIPQPLRSVVAQELQRHNVYKEAGVTKFREYIALAESAQIVTLGGTSGRDWVSFDSDWLQTYG